MTNIDGEFIPPSRQHPSTVSLNLTYMIRTATNGIFASDLLIRSACMEGIAQIRAQPWLLDYVFAWLPNDPLTQGHYGDREVQDAKDWFLNTEISVTMAYRTDRPALPCIGIELVESGEGGANSLGDIHYQPTEDVDVTEIVIKPAPVLGPFTPKAYNSITGLVTVPDGQSTSNVFVNNVLYDSTSNLGYPILQVVDSASFLIQAGIQANFTKAYIAPVSSFYTAHLESVEFQETYRLRCFVNSTPVHLTLLHAILTFILLRNKQDLLEARGFERTTLKSQGISLDQGVDGPELIYARDITITGFVRQYWPKQLVQKIDGILVYPLRILNAGRSPEGMQQTVNEQGWMLEKDDILGWTS